MAYTINYTVDDHVTCPIHQSIHLVVYQSMPVHSFQVHPSSFSSLYDVYVPIHVPVFNLSVRPFTCPSIYLSIHLPVHLCTCLPTYLYAIYLCTHLHVPLLQFTCPSIYLYYLSIPRSE